MRQIFLLREQGDFDGAARLQANDLGNAVRDFRLAHGVEALPESKLQEMFAREEARIADAVALAEILIPQLVAARAGAPVVTQTYVATREEPVTAPVIPFSSDDSSAVPRAPATGSPAIPDLLDAMLAAERHSRRATANKRQ